MWRRYLLLTWILLSFRSRNILQNMYRVILKLVYEGTLQEVQNLRTITWSRGLLRFSWANH